jgi:hypothetical protein
MYDFSTLFSNKALKYDQLENQLELCEKIVEIGKRWPAVIHPSKTYSH